MMRTAWVLARAGARSTHHHLIATCGGPVVVWCGASMIGLLSIALNAVLYGFLSTQLGDVVTALSGDGHDQQLGMLTGTLVQGVGVAGYGVVIMLLVLLPTRSNVAIAANVAGASKWATSLGEYLSVVVLAVAAVLFTQSGPLLYLAGLADQVPAAMVGLGATAAAFGVLAVVSVLVGQSLGALLRLRDGGARLLGILVASGVLLALLADIGTVLTAQRPPLVVRAMAYAWDGRIVPASWLAALASIGVLVLMLAAVALLARYAVAASSLRSGWRIGSARLIGSPAGVVNQFIREALLWARHPVTQLSLGSSALLVVLTWLGVRHDYVSPAMVTVLLVVLLAAGAETAFGRTYQWHWIYAVERVPAWRIVVPKLGVLALLQLTMLIASLLIVVPQAYLREAIVLAVPMFFALFALAFICGILIPFTDSAPTGMAVTSVVTLSAEGLLLFVEGNLLGLDGAGAAGFNLAVGIALSFAAWGLVRARVRPQDRAMLLPAG